MARAGILDRMKLSNQTLTVCLGGVGAIAAWMYKAALGHEDHADMRTWRSRLAWLWPFLRGGKLDHCHNERMVNAIALYQKNELGDYLKKRPSRDRTKCV